MIKIFNFKLQILLTILVLLISTSTVMAYAPKVYIEITDPVGMYNPGIVQKLNENLKEDLNVDEKFIITEKEEADFVIEGRVVAIGIGRLLNNVMGTSFTMVGSASSLFISPFTGPVISAAGFAQTQKNVFAIAVRVNVIRLNDNKVVRRSAFLGRTNLKKKEFNNEILDDTIKNTSELISKKLIKDVSRNKPKIFVKKN